MFFTICKQCVKFCKPKNAMSKQKSATLSVCKPQNLGDSKGICKALIAPQPILMVPLSSPHSGFNSSKSLFQAKKRFTRFTLVYIGLHYFAPRCSWTKCLRISMCFARSRQPITWFDHSMHAATVIAVLSSSLILILMMGLIIMIHSRRVSLSPALNTAFFMQVLLQQTMPGFWLAATQRIS